MYWPTVTTVGKAVKPPLTDVTAGLGARVRARRKELGLTQEKLADRADLHWTFVGQIERGQRNVTLHNIVKLADALEINPTLLVDGLTFHAAALPPAATPSVTASGRSGESA